MSEPTSYYIVESAAFIRPQQYIQSLVPGQYRITTDIEKASHFATLSAAKEASDSPGFWNAVRIFIPTLVIEVDSLAPPLEFDAGGPPNIVQNADKLSAEADINPDEIAAPVSPS